MLTAADFADTGQWRLLLEIYPDGMQAYLVNTLHTDIDPQPLCSVNWEKNPDEIKKNIEDAVYNHPRLLDDFATRVIIYDPRTLFIPTSVAEASAGAEEELYREVYEANTQDIMTDTDRDLTAVWCIGPGVKSFLMRTFPGARITCHLMEKVRNLRKDNLGIKLHSDHRSGELDLILLDGSDLLSASTHPCLTDAEKEACVANLLTSYGVEIH